MLRWNSNAAALKTTKGAPYHAFIHEIFGPNTSILRIHVTNFTIIKTVPDNAFQTSSAKRVKRICKTYGRDDGIIICDNDVFN